MTLSLLNQHKKGKRVHESRVCRISQQRSDTNLNEDEPRILESHVIEPLIKKQLCQNQSTERQTSVSTLGIEEIQNSRVTMLESDETPDWSEMPYQHPPPIAINLVQCSPNQREVGSIDQAFLLEKLHKVVSENNALKERIKLYQNILQVCQSSNDTNSGISQISNEFFAYGY